MILQRTRGSDPAGPGLLEPWSRLFWAKPPKGKAPKGQCSRQGKALFAMNFLNCSPEEPVPPVFRHFTNSTQSKLKENPPVLVKDPQFQQLQGPYQLIVWGRGCACVSTPGGPKWVPGKNIRLYRANTRSLSPPLQVIENKITQETAAPWALLGSGRR